MFSNGLKKRLEKSLKDVEEYQKGNKTTGVMKKPRCATLEEWSSWRKFYKKEYPVRYFLLETLPKLCRRWIRWYIIDFYWNCRNRFFSKYHLIDTGLNPKMWHDLDSKLIGAIKKLTINYVEKELDKNFSTFYPNENEVEDNVDMKEFWEEKIKTGNTLQEIYKWWKVDRPILKQKIDDIYKKTSELYPRDKDDIFSLDKRRLPSYEEIENIEKEIQKGDTDAAIKLVEIRGHLWT